MDFLYDNMSLPDSVDYPKSYYVQQVQTAMRARTEMEWGRSVPEREFRHFVLPPRVNNEDLDDFRADYYDELAERVAGLSMKDAILEVNHWCHEHVTYRPTSARTLGPASTIRTAYGRCGEESVLLVAALRTVCIPARQVYTPRWAHTDDNHAWVEAWADGQWWFLGACEPEPVLNLGWFNESASRGMLMHTKVYGAYDGPEEVVSRQPHLTEINVTDIYAPTRRLTVIVLDSLSHPVPDASVEFKLYNYAEFYTVARKQTDVHGQASLTAGLGDMLVWASTPDALAFKQVSFKTDSLVTLQLQKTLRPDASFTADFTIIPPAATASLPAVSPEQRAENDRRLAVEDSIRHAYEQTMTEQRCRGNLAVINAFRDSAAVLGQQAFAESLIAVLPDKDLQDVTLDVLLDNLPAGLPNSPRQNPNSPRRFSNSPWRIDELALPYLYSPRIERELLTPFKCPLRVAFDRFLAATDDEAPSVASIAKALIAWTRDSIKIVENRNPQRLRMRPLGVYRSRQTDALGRAIFFVAACRALGVPARINEIDGKVQFFDDEWITVRFENLVETCQPQGRLLLSYEPSQFIPDAKYYVHFTLSRLEADNHLKLLTYPEEATFANTFRNGVMLDAGTYVLTTGIRLADGSVLSNLQSFCVPEDGVVNVPLRLRSATDAVAVIGSLNAEDLFLPLTAGKSSTENALPTSLLTTCGRGYYILGLIAPNHEPTNHALRDIAAVSSDLEKWGRKLVLLFEDAQSANRFNFVEFQGLPSTVVWGSDIDGSIRREVVEQMHLQSAALPVFLVCDSFNRVVFVQQGYTIGLGEQLLKVIRQL